MDPSSWHDVAAGPPISLSKNQLDAVFMAQAAIRSYHAQTLLLTLQELGCADLEMAAAWKIQQAWRMHLCRMQKDIKQNAAIRIQSLFRIRRARLQARTVRKIQVEHEMRAVQLQSWVRGCSARQAKTKMLSWRRTREAQAADRKSVV